MEEFYEAEADLTYMTNPVQNERERLARIMRLRFQRIQKDIKQWLADEKESKENPDFWADNGGWSGWCERTHEMIDKWYEEPLSDAYEVISSVNLGEKYEECKK